MQYRDGPRKPNVRELRLHDGEWIEERFDPSDGIVSDTPNTGELMVLTNRRVISFLEVDGQKETVLASLAELQGVSIKANTRGIKSISQGLFLILLGILGYFIIGYILDGVTVALSLGGAIIFVGLLFISRYFFWEQEGSISFQGGNWEFGFPYRTDRASADVYKVVNRFFQLKMEPNGHQPRRDGEHTDGPLDAYTPAPPRETSTDAYIPTPPRDTPNDTYTPAPPRGTPNDSYIPAPPRDAPNDAYTPAPPKDPSYDI